MTAYVVELLDSREDSCAREVLRVSLAAYAVEAGLLGVEGFPPLRETVKDVQRSEGRFYGIRLEDRLAGVCELVAEGSAECISRLVVDPSFFRRGVARALMDFVVASCRRPLRVQTGTKNHPALRLYQSYGFEVYRAQLHPEGVEVVELVLQSSLKTKILDRD
jgi:ribosomal protein S18 acetylase RimI-like enzyme